MSNISLQQRVVEEFSSRFGASPACVVRAPGRVNLIGEHTDYNDGFVLPMTINRAVWIALTPDTESRVAVYSVDFGEQAEFSLETSEAASSTWAKYLQAVAFALRETGLPLNGWHGVIASDVPIGAGLSSSAALEMAAARAFSVSAGFGWDPAVIARIAQRAENRWVGVNCGIMDQLISGAGKAGHALLIDCRSLAMESVPLPADAHVVVLDTATRRQLADAAYNERRAQCQAAAEFFGVAALRDIAMDRLIAEAERLDPTTFRRARHVVSENERVLAAAAALRRANSAEFGRLMNASHVSLRDDYEVSSERLNQIVACAMEHPACFGARMTGAGFGGCGIALVSTDAAPEFAEQVAANYRQQSGLEPRVYLCTPTNGAEVVAAMAKP